MYVDKSQKATLNQVSDLLSKLLIVRLQEAYYTLENIHTKFYYLYKATNFSYSEKLLPYITMIILAYHITI